jgi:hypothetical protein
LTENFGQKYQLEIWWNNDFVRDEILKQISDILGLKYYDWEKDGDEKNIWRTPEIEIEIYVKDLGNLADVLVFDETAENETEENAFDRRANEICRRLDFTKKRKRSIESFADSSFCQAWRGQR